MTKNKKEMKDEFMAKKSVVTNVISGVAGGLLVLGGMTFYENNNNSNTSSSSSSVVKKVSYDVENNTTDAVNEVSDAVVSVINYQQSSQGSALDDFLGGNSNATEGSSASSEEESGEGSGVIYKKDEKTAYIVTNNHVVDGATSLEVILSSGEKVEATLVGKDAYSDLAVLKIDSSKVKKVAEFGDSSKLKVGETAIAIGSPLGSEYANSATEGIVSSLSRNVASTNESGQAVNINAIQTDAAINPGNSGGALINIAGQVIGINSSKIATTSNTSSGISVEGMGFAIPANDVVNIIEKLEANGEVARPALGIQMVDLSNIPQSTIKSELNLPNNVTSGVVIAGVQSNLPADKAGFKKYDVITKIGDSPVTSTVDLQSALYKYNIGDTVKVTYYRDGKEKTANVKLTESSKNIKFNTNQ